MILQTLLDHLRRQKPAPSGGTAEQIRRDLYLSEIRRRATEERLRDIQVRLDALQLRSNLWVDRLRAETKETEGNRDEH